MGSYGRGPLRRHAGRPGIYDYRRAALDAMHLPKLWDRLVQNLRRAVGYDVQYFAVDRTPDAGSPRTSTPPSEARSRASCCGRSSPPPTPRSGGPATTASSTTGTGSRSGTAPSAAMSTPTTACRCPPGTPRSTSSTTRTSRPNPPTWSGSARQCDMQGIVGGTPKADRRVGYLTKYLTKSITDPLDDEDDVSHPRQAHIDRLHEQVRWLPCSPRCWNWLAYGIQPKDAADGCGTRPLPAQGARPRTPRLRGPPRPGLPQVDRQDPHRPPR